MGEKKEINNNENKTNKPKKLDELRINQDFEENINKIENQDSSINKTNKVRNTQNQENIESDDSHFDNIIPKKSKIRPGIKSNNENNNDNIKTNNINEIENIENIESDDSHFDNIIPKKSKIRPGIKSDNENNNDNIKTNNINEIENIENIESDDSHFDNIIPKKSKIRPGIKSNNENNNDNAKTNNIKQKETNEYGKEKIEQIRNKYIIGNHSVNERINKEKVEEKKKFDSIRSKVLTQNNNIYNNNTSKTTSNKEININENKKTNINDLVQNGSNSFKNKIDHNKVKTNIESKIETKIEEKGQEKYIENNEIEKEQNNKSEIRNNNFTIKQKIVNNETKKEPKNSNLKAVVYIIIFFTILFFAGKLINNYINNNEVIIPNNTENIEKKGQMEQKIENTNQKKINIEGVLMDRHSYNFTKELGNSSKYINTLNYGMLKIKTKDDKRIRCRGLLTIQGYLIEKGINENLSINGSKELIVDSYNCEEEINTQKRYDVNVEYGYLKGYIINPFDENIDLKIEIGDLYEKEYNLEPNQKEDYILKLNCNNIFKDSNTKTYNMNIYLSGRYSLYNKKVDFTLTKTNCSALTVNNIIFDGLTNYDNNQMQIKKGDDIKIKAIIENIGGLDLYNTVIEIDGIEGIFENDSNYIATNKIIEIIKEIKQGEKHEVNIKIKPLKTGYIKLNGEISTNNIIGLKLDFSENILVYEEGIDYSYEITKVGDKSKDEYIQTDLKLTNNGQSSEYEIQLITKDFDMKEYDRFQLFIRDDSQVKKGNRNYYKKLILNDKIELNLSNNQEILLSTILFNIEQDLSIKITPKSDIRKSQIINLNKK